MLEIYPLKKVIKEEILFGDPDRGWEVTTAEGPGEDRVKMRNSH